jgi:hypothetical protein
VRIVSGSRACPPDILVPGQRLERRELYGASTVDQVHPLIAGDGRFRVPQCLEQVVSDSATIRVGAGTAEPDAARRLVHEDDGLG